MPYIEAYLNTGFLYRTIKISLSIVYRIMDLNSIISKIYVVTGCNKKLKRVHNRFNKIGGGKIKANIEKYKAVDLDDLDEDLIGDVTTPRCNELCSLEEIGQWLSHRRLWKGIVKRKEDGVLILEDTAQPISSFYDTLLKNWVQVPSDWDMVYFGCGGSCDSSIIKDTAYRVYRSRTNTDVEKGGRVMSSVMEPGFPLGVYGYLLSLKGAKKLLANEDLQKVDFGIDYSLAKKVLDTENFKAYSFNPTLIMKVEDPKSESDTNHSITKPFTSKIALSNEQSVGDLEEASVCYVRRLGVGLTYTTALYMMIALLMGYNGGDKATKVFAVVIAFLQLSEMAYTKTSVDKLKTLVFEMVLVIGSLALGSWLRQVKQKNMRVN
jgi:GR25 family glycosyltransferase involved in LPS biosynthesis